MVIHNAVVRLDVYPSFIHTTRVINTNLPNQTAYVRTRGGLMVMNTTHAEH